MSDDGFYRFDGIIRMGEPPRTNIDDALEIVADIQKLYSVQRELKAAFARSELDGGVKAAPSHPLYVECEERLEKLRDQLKMVF
ncbi:hypothetical protein SEA_ONEIAGILLIAN_12 [Microbacterium phage OneinaGillian]|uniref:Uncharacterized protein n=1 Tax=Microbacterium phage OneinaGillian TaxID=2301604 RepID=A0A385UE75_9CAUD|nr:hypothetical protein HOU23_gp012 [Microbacterium phage OneinaGillian]AYB70122.1 hypothetical protein SEA_ONEIAGILLIAN_12 [Microbacterium phage OneinaGillian]